MNNHNNNSLGLWKRQLCSECSFVVPHYLMVLNYWTWAINEDRYKCTACGFESLDTQEEISDSGGNQTTLEQEMDKFDAYWGGF